ncbi:hypothetical protein [Acidianus sp. HS-5]|uniref:hypothetical protein n=1 Tax=Acidianus sp. HS-5 TaxID=2886040 RepID=UPI001F1D101E|nr:hypothetical protein [Acidianus sp. HS-5]BDC17975.1 hypothetical protein HS5_08650 [Acidianus sp. HS-5]
MKYPLSITSLLLNIIVAVLPYCWWIYSVGGIIRIDDSIFLLNIYFEGQYLYISEFINVILIAFRAYVIAVSSYYLYTIFKKGVKKNYMLIAWASLFYILDPVIMYFLFNYVISYFLQGVTYPFFIIGQEYVTFTYSGSQITMLIESYPTLAYWFSLAVGIINLFSRISKKY